MTAHSGRRLKVIKFWPVRFQTALHSSPHIPVELQAILSRYSQFAASLRCRRVRVDFLNGLPDGCPGAAFFHHAVPHNSHFSANTSPGNNYKERNQYESNWHCPPGGRPGPDRHSQGNPQNPAYPRRRPVADIIDTVGEILFFYVGFGKKAGVVVVHSDD